MESTLRATGPLGPLSIPGKPERKTRRKKVQVTGEVSVSREGKSASAVEETGSSYVYARAASAETLSDVLLVEQTLSGKQEAFAVLVERYKDAVQNLAYRMLSN